MEITIKIANALGLHARPAAMFAQLASRFDAEVEVIRTDSGESADGKSIISLLTLAAVAGTELVIRTSGPEEGKSLDALAQLAENNFGEEASA